MNAGGEDVRSNRAERKSISSRRIIRLYLWISVCRLFNVWIIRTQFDPDEYWQTLEPAYCLAFGSDGTSYTTIKGKDHDSDRRRNTYGCALTWEWTRRWTPPSSSSEMESAHTTSTAFLWWNQALHGPVRSFVSILPTYVYYRACRPLINWAEGNDESDKIFNNGNLLVSNYQSNFQRNLKQYIHRNSTYLISKGPAFIHAVLVSAPTDLMVWLISSRISNVQSLIAKDCNQNAGWRRSWPFWALVCSLTSWFHGYALVRTYANSVETIMLILGIALLGPELFGQPHSSVNCHGRSIKRNGWRAKIAFIVGGLSVCVRFTSLAAWIPIGLILTLRSKKSFKIHTLLGLCAPFGLLGVILGCCIDRWFYGFWAVPFLGNIHFNVLLGHGSLYGRHPFLWYVYAGVPAICGVMLPFFFWEISVIRSGPRSLLLWIIIPYILLHSFSEHKEFRFLLPVLPIVCILVGHSLSLFVSMIANAPPTSALKRLGMSMSSNFILVALFLMNFPQLLYLGLIHQRGPIATNQYLASVIERETQHAIQSGASRQFSIHFLMGCHSAPAYSHLHIPNARVEVWHLDCSPECRSNPNIICESDRFLNDPLAFVRNVYRPLVDGDDAGFTIREKPSFLVLMQDNAVKIGAFLSDELKMSHTASIRHTIKSLSWHRQDQCDAPNDGRCSRFETQHASTTLFSQIDIHFDHMEIYKS